MNTNQKTILFKVVGSPQMGMGHVYRSLSMSKVLEKEFRILFHINDNPIVKNLLQEHDVSYFVNEPIEELVIKEQIDLLLFDQLSQDNGLFESLKSKHPHLKIVALDYFDYDNWHVDVIINLFNQNLQKSKPDKISIQYYEDINYAIIRDEFYKYIQPNKNVCPEVKNILITFGGVDHKKNTSKVIEFLKSIKMDNLIIDVVLGPLWKSDLPADLTSNIHLHNSISNMADYMFNADLVFCGSGTTMLELLFIGTPAIVIPQNSWEKRFAKSIEQKGAIKILDTTDSLQNVKDILHIINSYDTRKLLSRKGKSLVDGKGKERIYKIIHNNLTWSK